MVTATPEKKRHRGQPTKYKPEYAEQVYKLCLLKATDRQLADFFEVNELTINRWKKAHPDFCKSLKKGKLIADATIAESLYERARGYSHPEDKIFCNKDGEVTTVETTKHYPPDTAAAFIWLKNRAAWSDKQQIITERNQGEQIEVSDMKARLEALEGAGDGIPQS